MSRKKLPERRFSVTVNVAHKLTNDNEIHPLCTFGFGEEGLREVFCADFKTGSDNHALIMDACVLISRLLQHGYKADELAKSLCQPPSLLGSILKEAAEVEKDLKL